MITTVAPRKGRAAMEVATATMTKVADRAIGVPRIAVGTTAEGLPTTLTAALNALAEARWTAAVARRTGVAKPAEAIAIMTQTANLG